jgi:phosphoglycerate dehydrogenase-like enzyme
MRCTQCPSSNALLPQADFVALTCPLTVETEKVIDAEALGRMKPSAYLLNAARGRVVDEPALVDALARRQIRGAALDVMVEEPLPAASPLWAVEHVLGNAQNLDFFASPPSVRISG